MSEFCLECLKKFEPNANVNNTTTSTDLYLCEGCGQLKHVVVAFTDKICECDTCNDSVGKLSTTRTNNVQDNKWKLETHSFYADNFDESTELCIYITATCPNCGRHHPDKYEVYHKNIDAPEDSPEDFRFDKESEESKALEEFLQRDYQFARYCPDCGAKMDGKDGE